MIAIVIPIHFSENFVFVHHKLIGISNFLIPQTPSFICRIRLINNQLLIMQSSNNFLLQDRYAW